MNITLEGREKELGCRQLSVEVITCGAERDSGVNEFTVGIAEGAVDSWEEGLGQRQRSCRGQPREAVDSALSTLSFSNYLPGVFKAPASQ